MEIITDITRPGFCQSTALTDEMPTMADQFLRFMTRAMWGGEEVLDIGMYGYKSQRMKEAGMDVDQGYSPDFNYQPIMPEYLNFPDGYRIITCFETIEHVQNPLLFVKNIIEHLHPDGSLFLSTPCRPRFLWTVHHFFEMDGAHLQKWIFNPLGLEIVRKKKVRIPHHWTFYLKGFRPFMRLFFGYTWIYEVRFKKEK